MVHRHSTTPTKQQARLVRRPSETQSQFHERRLAALTAQLDDKHGICDQCWRVVSLRKDGTLKAHNHCPNATPRMSAPPMQLCKKHGNEISTTNCKCWERTVWGGAWVDKG